MGEAPRSPAATSPRPFRLKLYKKNKKIKLAAPSKISCSGASSLAYLSSLFSRLSLFSLSSLLSLSRSLVFSLGKLHSRLSLLFRLSLLSLSLSLVFSLGKLLFSGSVWERGRGWRDEVKLCNIQAVSVKKGSTHKSPLPMHILAGIKG